MSSQTQQASTKTEYFNLTIKGMGYLSNIRQVNGPNGTFISCVVNGLSGPTDNASYTRFDVTVAGKEASSLINRCQKSVDEDKKVLIGLCSAISNRTSSRSTAANMPVNSASASKPALSRSIGSRSVRRRYFRPRNPTLRRLSISKVPHSSNTRKTLSDNALLRLDFFRGVLPSLVMA